MADHNQADSNWLNHVHHSSVNMSYTDAEASLAILMDIRGELRRICMVLECPNATDIPNILRRIDGNTKKRKPKAHKKGAK
jgi:hypothetical protein